MNLNGNGADAARRGETRLNGSASGDTLLEAVDVRVEAFLGETNMTIAQLNALKAGGVVTLDALLNEPVELRVNGVRVAHGELVSVGDKFGVRITAVA